jgi:hypothetical protein
MPSIKIAENWIKPEYLEKIKKITSKIKKWHLSQYQEQLSQALQENFWIKPDFEDPRLSEAAKQI